MQAESQELGPIHPLEQDATAFKIEQQKDHSLKRLWERAIQDDPEFFINNGILVRKAKDRLENDNWQTVLPIMYCSETAHNKAHIGRDRTTTKSWIASISKAYCKSHYF